MKKVVFSLSFLFILSATINAQTIFGLKAGVNIANLKASVNNVTVTLDSKLGFNGGIFFTIPSGKNFSIQPEIVYSLEGAEYGQTNSKINLHWINIPVMFQYNAMGLIVEAGPQIGILASATENGVNATSEYENVNIALGLGAAYRLQEGLGFNARYNFGITPVAKDDSQDIDVMSNVFQIGLTFSVATIKRK